MTAPLLAHGLGDAGDLPVALPVVLFLAAGIVLLAAWRADRRTAAGAGAGRPLPRLTAFADHPATRGILRGLAVAALAIVVVTAALGPATAANNPAPRVVFVLFWGTLIPLSFLLGSFWRVVNPFRTIATGLARLSGDPEWRTAEPLPPGIGVWPAVVQLAVFVWAVIGASERAGRVLILVLAITAVQVLAANRYGPAWFRHGDPFEVVAELVASISPLARGADGVLVLRAPRTGATRAVESRTEGGGRLRGGLPVIFGLLIGGHLTDFVVDTPLWHEWRAPLTRAGQLGFDTVTLVLVVAVMVAAIVAVTRRGAFLLAALLPVVVGYAVAHDVGVLVIEGQFAFIQLSDPLGYGWDLLGLSGRYVPAEPVPAMAAALAVVAVLIAGHVAAMVLGRNLTAARFAGRAATAVQLPLRTFLVVSVVLAIALRLTVA